MKFTILVNWCVSVTSYRLKNMLYFGMIIYSFLFSIPSNITIAFIENSAEKVNSVMFTARLINTVLHRKNTL